MSGKKVKGNQSSRVGFPFPNFCFAAHAWVHGGFFHLIVICSSQEHKNKTTMYWFVFHLFFTKTPNWKTNKGWRDSFSCFPIARIKTEKWMTIYTAEFAFPFFKEGTSDHIPIFCYCTLITKKGNFSALFYMLLCNGKHLANKKAK